MVISLSPQTVVLQLRSVYVRRAVLVKFDGDGVSVIDYSEDAIEIRRLAEMPGL